MTDFPLGNVPNGKGKKGAKMQEILISKKENKKIITLLEDGKLEEVYEEKEDCKRLEGNIYLGKVKDILQGMQAAFVDIGEEKNTFIHIKDVLPKVSKVTGNKNEDLDKYNIKDYIKKDTSILVQVKKDATSLKGAKISTDLHIPGRFVVVMPKDNFITVSQKIEDENERERLINIAKETIKNDIGLIIRTAAEGKDENIIKKDIEQTIKKWNDIKKESESLKENEIPKVLYKNDSIIEKILLDTVDNGIQKVIVDDTQMLEDIKRILKNIDESSKVNVELKQTDNLLDMYDTDDQIEKLSARKIWLKCGGFITIDKTEALTAIDVNSGKFTGKKNLEETVLKVNEEASCEIARQLRLRDIGGIIIIDYIDMQETKSREQVLETLKQALKKDRSKTQVIEFTKLNLLEMTRKHMFSEN
ncbi:MAG: Rne/Rng family ribonuclease [Clostridia bacterium]|nr:Rne/Rng family ribonuclease [Clostridia bacterium]